MTNGVFHPKLYAEGVLPPGANWYAWRTGREIVVTDAEGVASLHRVDRMTEFKRGFSDDCIHMRCTLAAAPARWVFLTPRRPEDTPPLGWRLCTVPKEPTDFPEKPNGTHWGILRTTDRHEWRLEDVQADTPTGLATWIRDQFRGDFFSLWNALDSICDPPRYAHTMKRRPG